MKQEIDLHKEATEEREKELQELRAISTNRVQEQQQSTEEIEKKVQETEQKFTKLKGVYQQLREDHIKVFTGETTNEIPCSNSYFQSLTEIRDLRSRIDTNEKTTGEREEELKSLKSNLEQSTQERAFFESQVPNNFLLIPFYFDQFLGCLGQIGAREHSNPRPIVALFTDQS